MNDESTELNSVLVHILLCYFSNITWIIMHVLSHSMFLRE